MVGNVRWEMQVKAATTAVSLEIGLVADGGTIVLNLTPCPLSMA